MSVLDVYKNQQKRLQNLGRLIREFRRCNAMSQKELAERICIHRNTLRKIEHGTVGTRIDTLLEIADYFHVDVCEMLADIDGED